MRGDTFVQYDALGRATIVDGDDLMGAGEYALGAAAPSPKDQVKGMQARLRGIGFSDVRPTGKLDRVTVEAINSIFNGWDDAPPALRTGTLTDRQIAANLGTVQKYMKKAVGEAQMMLNADKGE